MCRQGRGRGRGLRRCGGRGGGRRRGHRGFRWGGGWSSGGNDLGLRLRFIFHLRFDVYHGGVVFDCGRSRAMCILGRRWGGVCLRRGRRRRGVRHGHVPGAGILPGADGVPVWLRGNLLFLVFNDLRRGLRIGGFLIHMHRSLRGGRDGDRDGGARASAPTRTSTLLPRACPGLPSPCTAFWRLDLF